jgi:hypothetical protein
METTKPKPRVKLIGRDGNAFAILGACRRALRRAGYTEDEVEAFTDRGHQRRLHPRPGDRAEVVRGRMTTRLSPVVLVLATACQYPAALGPYDFSVAASAGWVVTLSNGDLCRERPWNTAGSGHGVAAVVVVVVAIVNFVFTGRSSHRGGP